jgi:hypothetical protein
MKSFLINILLISSTILSACSFLEENKKEVKTTSKFMKFNYEYMVYDFHNHVNINRETGRKIKKGLEDYKQKDSYLADLLKYTELKTENLINDIETLEKELIDASGFHESEDAASMAKIMNNKTVIQKMMVGEFQMGKGYWLQEKLNTYILEMNHKSGNDFDLETLTVPYSNGNQDFVTFYFSEVNVIEALTNLVIIKNSVLKSEAKAKEVIAAGVVTD